MPAIKTLLAREADRNIEEVIKVDQNDQTLIQDELREYVDALENLVDDETWPLPKFWEMLFIC